MSKIETLEDFYRIKLDMIPGNLQRDIGHFNVFRLEDCVGENAQEVKYSRREFYKLILIRGKNRYHYAEKSVEIDGTALIFFNPRVPYTWEPLTGTPTGYFCIFREGFFNGNMRSNINELPMFAPGGKPVYILNKAQDKQIEELFIKMKTEIVSDYRYKYDLIRNYVNEIIHTALKLEPSETLYDHPDANSRLTALFIELLERQFPIETTSQRFTLRSATDFAQQLAVHVNHLNRSIKHVTGKTTSHHIFERMVNEAKALLKHTNWNISEISYCLGFEEPSHFNNFFKKLTGQTPTAFRVV
jgi:AraC family transcriptional regulator, transcriptional activator of pobA